VRRLLAGRAARPCLSLSPIPAFELPARRHLGLRAVSVWKLVAGESLSGESHTSKVRIINPHGRSPWRLGDGKNMLQWLRRRAQAERLAQADAEALIRGLWRRGLQGGSPATGGTM
jgi:hypothetical protein